GAGALYVMLPTGEQWRLQPDDEGRVFSGPWRPHARADFVSFGNVQLTIEQSWTEAQVAAEREAIERFLGEALQKPTRFGGFVRSKVGSNPERFWPVALELQVAADGNATGQAWLIGQSVVVQLSGRRAGNSIS